MREVLRAAAVLLLLLVVAPLAARGQQQPVANASSWSVVGGEGLVRAVEEFGRSNSDMVVQLPASTIIDLSNTFRWATDAQAVGGKAYSKGVLTLQGASPLGVSSNGAAVPSSVINAAMRTGLTPLLLSAFLNASQVAFVNPCVTDLTLSDTRYLTPMILGIFSLSPVVKSMAWDRITLYVPQHAVGTGMYLGTTFLCPWPAFKQSLGSLMAGLTIRLTPGTVPRVTPYEYTSDQFTAMADGVHTYRSVDAPGDPLMAFMRARGMLMEARFCNNGSVFATWEMLGANPDTPMWLVGSVEGLGPTLVNASALALMNAAAKRPVPGVMFFNATTALPDASTSGGFRTLQLDGPLLLCATIFNATVPLGTRPALDLTKRTTPLWNASATGQIMVLNLVIQAPAWPLPTSNAVSALPLSALVSTTSASSASPSQSQQRLGALIELTRTTLVVPVLDFLALVTLATESNASGVASVRACMDASVLSQAALLAPGIQDIIPGSITSWDTLNLTAYTGWGVNASRLIVRPGAPLPADLVQRCLFVALPPPPAAAAASSGDSDSSSAPVGLIVGCTVGGVALLAALAAGAVLLQRRRRKRYTAGKTGPPCGLEKERSSPFLGQALGASGAHAAAPASKPCSGSVASGSVASALSAGLPPGSAVPQGSRLMALLRSQEHHLLAPGSGAETAGAGDSGAAAAGGLHQAHDLLMQSLVGTGPRAGGATSEVSGLMSSGGSGASRPTEEHQRAVQQLATRLKGPGDGPDTVVLERVLGQGGGGTVYKGTWRGLPVAVKTMVFEAWEGGAEGAVVPNNKAELRYLRAVMETAISASIGHLHVVATYYHDIKRMDDAKMAEGGDKVAGAPGDAALNIQPAAADDGAPAIHTFKVFLVQELCTCSLHTAMHNKALDSEHQTTVLSLLHQVACGLEYLHGLGIIHGDLTPGNILLKADTAGGSVIVKLADFGLSNRLDAHATHVSNFGGGTPFYVAPEVVTLKRTSPASDIFSFGVVAWQVLARCQPFMVAPDGTFKRNPLFPRFPTGTEPPPEVEQLIKRCLSAHPHKRPAASEILKVLDKALSV